MAAISSQLALNSIRVLLIAASSVVASCATYQDSYGLPLESGGSAGDAQSGAGTAGSDMVQAGSTGSSGAGNTSAGATASAGTNTGSGGAGGAGSGGTAGLTAAGGMGGRAGSTATGGSAGMLGSAGSAGKGGATASGGSSGGGGSAGSAAGATGSAGAAGSSAVDHLLSQAKTATADSEQLSASHPAASGNDGSLTTRWCAADGAVGHYWQVDLGALSTLSKLQVTWEKAVVYKFKVEGSPDGTSWSSLLDQTNSTNANADQSYPLSQSPTARYVRLTVTQLPNPTTWASFFEFAVFGH